MKNLLVCITFIFLPSIGRSEIEPYTRIDKLIEAKDYASARNEILVFIKDEVPKNSAVIGVRYSFFYGLG
jgi:hypothetical protein